MTSPVSARVKAYQRTRQRALTVLRTQHPDRHRAIVEELLGSVDLATAENPKLLYRRFWAQAQRQLKQELPEEFDAILTREWQKQPESAGGPIETLKAAVCGTLSGYTRHRRRGEPACWPCRVAQSDFGRARSVALHWLADEHPARYRQLRDQEEAAAAVEQLAGKRRRTAIAAAAGRARTRLRGLYPEEFRRLLGTAREQIKAERTAQAFAAWSRRAQEDGSR